MFTELMALLDPPEPFAKSPAIFWDDPHISAQLLAAHLDPGYEGASRKPDFIDHSTAFIAAKMPRERFPRLWDFGCGPGLYTQRLAKLGYEVTGLDLSRRSIAYAEKSAQGEGLPIRYRRKNYLDFHEACVCDAALLIYCDLGALSREDRATLLSNIFLALRPGGRLLLDVFTPQKLAAFSEERFWQAFPKGGFWSGRPHLLLQANRRYPKRVSLEQTVLFGENELRHFYIWNQYFTQEALAKEAEAAGFSILGLYGDVAGAPLTDTGETLAALLEKPAEGG